MLLSGLLNTAGVRQRDAVLAQRLQPPVVQQHDQPAALPEAAGCEQASSVDDHSAEFSAALPDSPSLLQRSSSSSSGASGERTSAAAVPTAGGSPPPPGSSQHSFADADEDTVLTGSPVAADSLEAPSSCSTGNCSPLVAPDQLPAGPSLDMPAPAHAAALAAAAAPAGCRQQWQQGSDSVRPPREAVKQRVWSFQAIPPGTASIPSKGAGAGAAAAAAGVAGSAAVPCSGSGSDRPAFYTRAGPPAPGSPGAAAAAALPLQAAPAAVKAAGASGALSAAQRRQQRLEQLSRPRHVTPRHHQKQQQGAGAASAAAAPPAPAAPEQGKGRRHAEFGSAHPSVPATAAAAASSGIAAWRPAQPPLQQQVGSGTGSEAVAGAGSTGRWPQRLGEELSAGELQRATGAYSEERFQQRMGQLSATLAARQAQRCQVADATAAGEGGACRGVQKGNGEDTSCPNELQRSFLHAGVDDFVARVQQLGNGTGGCRNSAGGPAVEPCPAGDQAGSSWAQQEAPGAGSVCSAVACSQQPAAATVNHAAAAGQPLASEPEPNSELLPESPTSRLLLCQQQLQRRPRTAPGLGTPAATAAGASCEQQHQQQGQRPASSSPGKVKSLMQVRGSSRWLDRRATCLASSVCQGLCPHATI